MARLLKQIKFLSMSKKSGVTDFSSYPKISLVNTFDLEGLLNVKSKWYRSNHETKWQLKLKGLNDVTTAPFSVSLSQLTAAKKQ